MLRLFLNNHDEAYFVRELTRRIGAQINAVRNELNNLLAMGIVVESDAPVGDDERPNKRAAQRKYYRLNTESIIFPELRALFLKARVLLEKDFVGRLSRTGNISYLALTGHFVGDGSAPTDLFIVGQINRNRLKQAISKFERDVGQEINYTVMSSQEFKYRREVTDKFLFSILESRKIVVRDSVMDKLAAPAV